MAVPFVVSGSGSKIGVEPNPKPSSSPRRSCELPRFQVIPGGRPQRHVAPAGDEPYVRHGWVAPSQEAGERKEQLRPQTRPLWDRHIYTYLGVVVVIRSM